MKIFSKFQKSNSKNVINKFYNFINAILSESYKFKNFSLNNTTFKIYVKVNTVFLTHNRNGGFVIKTLSLLHCKVDIFMAIQVVFKLLYRTA